MLNHGKRAAEVYVQYDKRATEVDNTGDSRHSGANVKSH